MLRIPDYCSEEIYAIMRMCWHLTPENRPKFSHLRTLLQDVNCGSMLSGFYNFIQIKFMTAVCRTAQQSALDYRHLPLEVSEQVVLISERQIFCWKSAFASKNFIRKFISFEIFLCFSKNIQKSLRWSRHNFFTSLGSIIVLSIVVFVGKMVNGLVKVCAPGDLVSSIGQRLQFAPIVLQQPPTLMAQFRLHHSPTCLQQILRRT